MANRRGDWLQPLHCTLDRRRFDCTETIGTIPVGACPKLCRKSGGDLDQIKFLLGHSPIQTTERYLGSEQEIAVAVNDRWSCDEAARQPSSNGSHRR
jgi:hypothetical protein